MAKNRDKKGHPLMLNHAIFYLGRSLIILSGDRNPEVQHLAQSSIGGMFLSTVGMLTAALGYLPPTAGAIG